MMKHHESGGLDLQHWYPVGMDRRDSRAEVARLMQPDIRELMDGFQDDLELLLSPKAQALRRQDPPENRS